MEERLAKLAALGDPLPQIARLVDWEGFRRLLESTLPVRREQGGCGWRIDNQTACPS